MPTVSWKRTKGPRHAMLPHAVQGEVAVPIGKVNYPGVRGGLFAANPTSGKPALSHFQVVRRDLEKGQTVVEVEIFTGAQWTQAGGNNALVRGWLVGTHSGLNAGSPEGLP